jgi:transcriptional regulator with XRE-family HTH domain
MSEFGEWIKAERRRCGLTQKRLAELVGVGQGYISRLESGGADIPSAEVLRGLADAFGAPVERAYEVAGLIPPPVEELRALGRPDPELRYLLEKWPETPPLIRQALVAVVRSWRNDQAQIDELEARPDGAPSISEEKTEYRP